MDQTTVLNNKTECISKGLTFPLLNCLWRGMSHWLFRDVQFNLVKDFEDFRSVSHLAYQSYSRQGLQVKNTSRLRLFPQQLLPNTVSFSASYKSKLIGTVTLVKDSPLGLPMDSIYKDELQALRDEGKTIVEVTMLAVNKPIINRIFSSSRRLLFLLLFFKTMFDYLRSEMEADEMVACFHPRHDVLYKFLQFKPLGGLKSYDRVNGAPALGKRFNVREVELTAKSHIAYKLFFGKIHNPEQYKGKFQFSRSDLQRLYTLEPSFFRSLDRKTIDYLKLCYSDFDFEEIFSSPRSGRPVSTAA